MSFSCSVVELHGGTMVLDGVEWCESVDRLHRRVTAGEEIC